MEKMGATNGVGLIVYTGTREDLCRKLRERDDRITDLEAALDEITTAAYPVAGAMCVPIGAWENAMLIAKPST